VAVPLLLVGGFLLVTGRGPDNLGMAFLVAANVVGLIGVAVGAWMYPRSLDGVAREQIPD